MIQDVHVKLKLEFPW